MLIKYQEVLSCIDLTQITAHRLQWFNIPKYCIT